MRLVIERGELLRALSHVTSVVERRTTIPILSNVMLSASGRSLRTYQPT
jgi:DNA polymerase III subunit beta